MFAHAAELVSDQVAIHGNEYDEDEADAVDRIKLVGKAKAALVLTGDEMSPSEAEDLLRAVVETEVADWVPDASQRLVCRATAALGFPLLSAPLSADHGPDPGDHALIRSFVAGLSFMQCATCHRLFKD